MARRRRPRLPFILQPAPLTAAFVFLIATIWAIWPSRGKTPPKLTGEVESPALTPLARPVQSPAAAPTTPAKTEARVPSTPPPPAEPPRESPAPAPQTTITGPPAPTAIEPPGDYQAGLAARTRNDPLQARELLNRALHSGLTREQMDTARQMLSEIANQTVFSTSTVAGDPLVESHQIASGETLGKLAKQYNISEDLLSEVNKLRDKHFIRQGMRLKIVKGPFHASISKSDHLLHLFLADSYVRSYRVALGVEGKTPTGKWKVANHQTNPGWVDPHTGKRFHPDDPANPIGEYWIGLEGIEGAAVGAFGYGIHGTNEPQTIGKDVSLGCVRLGPEDIAVVYKLLLPGASFVTISD